MRNRLFRDSTARGSSDCGLVNNSRENKSTTCRSRPTPRDTHSARRATPCDTTRTRRGERDAVDARARERRGKGARARRAFARTAYWAHVGTPEVPRSTASGAMTLSPALTPDEVDAPHVASIVEQYHGAWRDRAHVPNSARAFTEVRFAPDLARYARTRVSRVRFLFSRVRLSSSPKTDRRAATPRRVDRSTALDAPRGV